MQITEAAPHPSWSWTTPPGSRVYRVRRDDGERGTIIVSRDEGRLHFSFSWRDRVPSWQELSEARDKVLPPDVFLCVPFPPRAYWINVHPHALHLYEVRDPVLTKMWRELGEDPVNRALSDGGG